MGTSKQTILGLVFVGVVAGGLWWLLYDPLPANGTYDAFSQCLADKKFVMYGAEWCSHCQNEKRAFGDSFQYVSYVECPTEPEKCVAQKIEEYPTWITGDGERLVGEQGLQKLSERSGCALP
ncbi:MAG: hypothetical protein NUV53_01985 [Patescibacteria group bacterium]|nr:hypothetical protein [Patescibacteria group bacterium]